MQNHLFAFNFYFNFSLEATLYSYFYSMLSNATTTEWKATEVVLGFLYYSESE